MSGRMAGVEGKNILDVLSQPGALPPRELAALRAWSTTFFPFQAEWLFCAQRFAACVKARQIGMSHTTSAAATLWGAMLGEPTTVLSVGEREAIEVLGKAKKHANVLVGLGSKWARHDPKTLEINFESGGRIVALPASSGGRSYSGNVFLDEYAYVQDADKIWDGAGAVALHGYKMRVASTPNGVGNQFWSLITKPEVNKGWAIHTIDIKRAIADGMKVDLDACWSMAKGDPRLFAQLFECSFLDGDLQYIPTHLIEGATVADPPLVQGYAYAGLDIGLENDLTALTIVKEDAKGNVWEQETITCKRTNWDDQMAILEQSFHDWEWKRICVDSTGLGAVPAQQLQRRFGLNRVEPVVFTLQSKELLATGLYQALAEQRLAIRDDARMKRDLCSLRRIVSTSGNVKYDVQRTAEGHGDRAWSLALAVHACSKLASGRPGARTDYGPGDFGA